MSEVLEPRTRAGRYLYHGMAIRGLEHKAARDIVAIEQEAAALASPSLDAERRLERGAVKAIIEDNERIRERFSAAKCDPGKGRHQTGCPGDCW